MRVLVVEDEPKVAADIASALTRAGYVPEVVDDGDDAWFRGDTESYSAIVLDLGLPKLDGLSVLRRWRAAGLSVPIIILTARGSWTERVEGIDAGADDYLAKPFEVEELLARLRAIIRRSAGVATPLITVGEVEVDPRQMRISVAGKPVQLSPLEYRAASYLMHSRGRVVSQQELGDHIYGGENYRENNTLEVLIGRLRRKIGVDLIVTRRGYGYVVRDDDAAVWKNPNFEKRLPTIWCHAISIEDAVYVLRVICAREAGFGGFRTTLSVLVATEELGPTLAQLRYGHSSDHSPLTRQKRIATTRNRHGITS